MIILIKYYIIWLVVKDHNDHNDQNFQKFGQHVHEKAH